MNGAYLQCKLLEKKAMIIKSKLTIVPVSLANANDFVGHHHRHHKPVVGHKFSIAVNDENGNLRGVCIVGRPTARMSDDGMTLEVVRVATDGCDNACSALYGAARRAAKAIGYTRIITYTLPEESGASLRGAGWNKIGEAGGGSWSRAKRLRVDKHPLQKKIRWEASLCATNAGMLCEQ